MTSDRMNGCSATSYYPGADETIIDNQTGLVWEKKTGGNAGATFTWSGGSPWEAADGTVFTTHLPPLNGCTSDDGATTYGGWSGHCDWRLPTLEELRTIADENCGQGPCTAWDNTDTATFGPTAPSYYWSASTKTDVLINAWFVHFSDGNVYDGHKSADYHVRAVRGGS